LIELSGLLTHKVSFYLPPYWSRQHGAYITLMISWLIAVLLSDGFHWLQPLILLFSLSALNLAELTVESIGRKTRLPDRKRFWLISYLIISVFSSIILILHLESLMYLLPVFIIFGILFIWLSSIKKQKSVLAEWITFAFLALAGLLALNPGIMPDIGVLVVMSLLMAAYFGQSIFLVKSRLKKMAPDYILIYSLPVIILTLFLVGLDWFTCLFSILLLAKALQAVIFSGWYNKLKIKWVGMLELGFHLIFVLILYVFSNLVLSYHTRFFEIV